MKVLVDGRTFTKTSAGITSFLRCSLQHWASLHPEHVFYVYIPKRVDKTFDISIFPENIHFIQGNGWKWIPNIIFIFLLIPYYVRKLKADVYYTPVPCLPYFIPKSIKKMIVVHDVVNYEFKSTMQWQNRLATVFVFKRSVETADYIWTNSHYTKKCVEHYIPIRKCKNIYVGDSADDAIFYRCEISQERKMQIKEKFGINGRFILFVGTLEPRKNLTFLLEIMPEIYKAGYQLLIVGGRGWKNSSCFDIVSSDGYPKEANVFCGYVTNEELSDLYRMAECLVSASLNEGFGLPQLEALKCGCRVVTAHNSAMIEVAEGIQGAYTVEGYDQQTWIDAILKCCKEKKEVKGSRLNCYDWNFVIEGLLEYIR